MMWVVLVGILPSDPHYSCKKLPYGCGNELIEEEGYSICHLICLHLVEKTHLAGYKVKDDGTDGCHIYFTAHEYTIGNTAMKLNNMVLRITDVVMPDCTNSSMRVLYHHNHGYASAEVI